jgi:protein TonB
VENTPESQPPEKATTTASTQTATTPGEAEAPSNGDRRNTAANQGKGAGPAQDNSAGQGRGAEGTTTGETRGGGAVGARQDYLARLRAWLERHKEYPRRARLRRLEGVVTLRLVIEASGRVLNAELAGGSGHASLDEAGLAMVARAQPLPAMPDSMDRNRLVLRVPVRFGLR